MAHIFASEQCNKASAPARRKARTVGSSASETVLSALQARADASAAGSRLTRLQTQAAPVQRLEEEEPQQMKPIQRVDEEDLMQGKMVGAPLQRQDGPAPSGGGQGLPAGLQTGVSALSGADVSDVSVHYNSSAPAQVGAHAYAQGRDIHVAPGQEQHLPHEAWHVVQQAEGRVRPTGDVAGVAVNDDPGLEREADTMGARAAQMAQKDRG